MDVFKLKSKLKDQPTYRKDQINQLIFKDLISEWDEATTLPKSLRESLKGNTNLSLPYEKYVSENKKTIKFLITLSYTSNIETVIIKHNDNRRTLCLSSQVGCVLGCKFCATGHMGFKRNLTPKEIVLQYLIAERFLKEEKDSVTNLVFMGMGEPLLNYSNVISAIKTLNDPKKAGIGIRRFSISTVGIVDKIYDLAKSGLQVNLAFSLHAPNNQLRSRLMPINSEYNLEAVLKALRYFYKKTKRKIMIEYVMLKGINDKAGHARELADLLRELKIKYLVNLIPCNPVLDFKAPTTSTIRRFKSHLEKRGIEVVERYTFGQDIKAACGQLATNLD